MKEDNKIKSRKEATLLAQLRSGHCKEPAAYQHRIDSSKNEKCPSCLMEAETMQHWLSCPATVSERQSLWSWQSLCKSVGAMTKQTEFVQAYTKEKFHLYHQNASFDAPFKSTTPKKSRWLWWDDVKNEEKNRTSSLTRNQNQIHTVLRLSPVQYVLDKGW